MAECGSTSATARSFLPAVLGLLSTGPAACDVFKEAWRDVPLGAFVPWVSQMLSRVGEREGRVLLTVLEDLARRCALSSRLGLGVAVFVILFLHTCGGLITNSQSVQAHC